MKDKQQSYFVNIGSSSLLVIFLILCLVTFAILSLSSARSDYTFSERMAEHKQAYYEASARAETIVAAIDDIFYEAADGIDLNSQLDADEGADDPTAFSEYITRVSGALNGVQIEEVPIQIEQADGEYMVSFRVPAGEKQALLVALRITDYRQHVNYYEVKMWKIVNTEEWESEQPLKLISAT